MAPLSISFSIFFKVEVSKINTQNRNSNKKIKKYASHKRHSAHTMCVTHSCLCFIPIWQFLFIPNSPAEEFQSYDDDILASHNIMNGVKCDSILVSRAYPAYYCTMFAYVIMRNYLWKIQSAKYRAISKWAIRWQPDVAICDLGSTRQLSKQMKKSIKNHVEQSTCLYVL